MEARLRFNLHSTLKILKGLQLMGLQDAGLLKEAFSYVEGYYLPVPQISAI